MTSINIVKQTLVDAYGGFADKRIKKLESGSWFEVDGRGASDYGADRKLFSWFCTINVEVMSGDEVVIVIGSAIPKNATVEKWLLKHVVPTGKYGRPGIVVKKGEQGILDDLAVLVMNVVKKPYSVKAYKYVAPATASALSDLRKVLDRAWAS
jgi:hypothetical protein